MQVKSASNIRVIGKAILMGIGLAALFWILDSAIRAFVFRYGTFIECILFPTPHDIWKGFMVGVLLVMLSVYGQVTITKSKRAEEALRASEQNFRNSLDNSPFGIRIVAAEGGILYANQAILDIYGYSSVEELKTVPTIQRYTPESYAEHQERKEKRKLGKPVPPHYGVSILRKDGEVRHLEMFRKKVVWDGKTQFQVIYQDITERKQAEEMLRESEEKYESLVNNVRLGIFRGLPGPTGRFLEVNPAMEEITGYSRAELLQMDVSELYVYPEEREAVLEEIASATRKLTKELSFKRKDGTEIVISDTKAAVRDSAGKILWFDGILEDITERKQVEEKLKKTMVELESSNAKLERFAHVASHDLQEPLRMIASYVQLLQRRYQGKLDAAADEFIGYVVGGAKRMQAMVEGLLRYSRVSTTGKDFEPTDCESVLEAALANLRVTIEESGAVITHDLLPTVMADDVQLSRLFQNLIDNAIRFRSNEPPRVHISAEPREEEWLFSVRDDGIGIDPQYAKQVFTVFRRLHGTEEYPGVGIGLAICQRIVEHHGGRIWVESPPGEGSTFYFTFKKLGGK